MKAEHICLSDYIKSGEGANGESYDCISDPGLMVKIYNEGYPVQSIYDELEVAHKVYLAGVPSPEPGELVTDGRRLGIRFRRIKGKRSFSRIFAEEPERTEEFSRELARFFKQLHSMECENDTFPDAKEQFRKMLKAMDFLTEPQMNLLLRTVNEMPDGNNLLHGDMHFGNVITNLPKGAPLDEPHDTYFIDLGYFSKGHPLIDLGMMANICIYSSDEFIRHDMHISKVHAGEIFEYFLDEYFFAEDRIAEKWFGPGQNPDSIKKVLRKSYLVKSILVSYNLGFVLPETVKEIDAMIAEQES